MISIISSYVLPTEILEAPEVNSEDFGVVENGSLTLTSENQFAILNLKAYNKYKSATQVLLNSVLPTGVFLGVLFPDTFPTAFILMLNVLWGFLLLISLIEVLRGFNVW